MSDLYDRDDIREVFEATGEQRATKQQIVLAELQNGTVKAREFCMKHGFEPWGQISQLRSKGYEIETIKDADEGGFYYRFGGERVDRYAVTGSMKTAYYDSSHWRKKAEERKQFDSYCCTHCKAKTDLETHHWDYPLFNETMRHLQTFCIDCHAMIHSHKNVQIHFPKYVDPDTYEKLLFLLP